MPVGAWGANRPGLRLATMRLGVNLGYWGAGNDADNLALAREADRLGYSVAWAAEAYGSDAPTVLSWVAAQTQNIDVGSAVFQIPGRTPANCAMTAATLDTLSGGRFRLGLGVSGPQVSEGWHGVKFDKPLARTREYTEIVRKALRRERLTYDGEFFTLPLPDGPGKALTLTVHPVREHIPMYLAAIGPKNLELTGELFDGRKAAQMRLVNESVPLAQLRDRTRALARTLLGKNPHTLRAAKLGVRFSEQMDWESAAEYLTAKSDQTIMMDPERGREKGLQQFLDEKSYKPGLGAYRRDE